ncbi:hypothetical protein [Ornithinimicrobium sp. W1665]|uniref:hypothetical protein n=1 Tax=Ornithinimicrobium sp. W1665 TaxID=3416666 RepID=UPI003CF258A0
MTWIWLMLLVVGLVLLGYTVVRVLLGGLADGSGGADLRAPSSWPRAQQVLDERYSAGVLSTQEYEHRRGVLARGEDGS